MPETSGIIVFTLWYIAIAYNYYMGTLPVECTDSRNAEPSRKEVKRGSKSKDVEDRKEIVTPALEPVAVTPIQEPVAIMPIPEPVAADIRAIMDDFADPEDDGDAVAYEE